MAKTEKKTEVRTLYKRLKTTGHFESENYDYEIPKAAMGEKEVVDKDNFIPINEALKKLDGKRELTGDEVETYYDFANGVDNHGEIPFNRTAENTDLAVLSETIRNKQNQIRNKINEGIEEYNLRAETAQSFTKNEQE